MKSFVYKFLSWFQSSLFLYFKIMFEWQRIAHLFTFLVLSFYHLTIFCQWKVLIFHQWWIAHSFICLCIHRSWWYYAVYWKGSRLPSKDREIANVGSFWIHDSITLAFSSWSLEVNNWKYLKSKSIIQFRK